MSLKALLSGEAGLIGHTGYSGQLGYIAETFKTLGYEVAHYAWANLVGGSVRQDGVDHYPRIGKQGRNAHFVAEHAEADLVFTLQDLWPLPEQFGEHLHGKGLPWIAYFPIDGAPLMDKITFHAEEADYPVVYSKFGERVAREAGLDVDYIPHAIDTDLFRPQDKAALRRKHDFDEETFLVTMICTNMGYPSRKSIPEAMDAFAQFQKRHEEALFYFHGNIHHHDRGGYPILLLAERLQIPRPNFSHVHQIHYAMGLPPEHMAELYAMSDVLLMPSAGEGFGLPIVEAQACGTPVITQDCSSMPELTVNGVAIPKGQRFWRTPGDLHYIPRIEDIENALETIYRRDADEAAEQAERGRRFVVENYSHDVVREKYWRPFMERVERDLAPVIAGHNGQEAEVVPA